MNGVRDRLRGIGIAYVFSAGLIATAGCNDSPTSDPEFVGDWAITEPRTMPAKTTQSECTAGDPTAPPAATVSAVQPPLPAEFQMTLHDARFRCQQVVCGHVQDFGEVVRVLVQPCDLHPKTVPKCDCTYDITVSLPPRAFLPNVSFYVRSDFYGATGDNPPTPVGEARATSTN